MTSADELQIGLAATIKLVVALSTILIAIGAVGVNTQWIRSDVNEMKETVKILNEYTIRVNKIDNQQQIFKADMADIKASIRRVERQISRLPQELREVDDD